MLNKNMSSLITVQSQSANQWQLHRAISYCSSCAFVCTYSVEVQILSEKCISYTTPGHIPSEYRQGHRITTPVYVKIDSTAVLHRCFDKRAYFLGVPRTKTLNFHSSLHNASLTSSYTDGNRASNISTSIMTHYCTAEAKYLLQR